MFTIKHIDGTGGEFAIEAESYSIEFERNEGKSDLIRFLAYDAPYREQNYKAFWVGVRETGGNPRSLDSQSIYVMNRYGATVASVHFEGVPSDYWGAVTDCQADPEKLAA